MVLAWVLTYIIERQEVKTIGSALKNANLLEILSGLLHWSMSVGEQVLKNGFPNIHMPILINVRRLRAADNCLQLMSNCPAPLPQNYMFACCLFVFMPICFLNRHVQTFIYY